MMNWEINGLSLNFDQDDLETAERCEKAFDLMEQEEHRIAKKNYLKKSDLLRDYCNLYFHFFENLFGRETAGQIFQNQPVNTKIYEETYISFLKFSVMSSAAAFDERSERFRPFRSGNRKQRRASKKHKKPKK
ncbi:MAG: hypothetical protein IJ642_12215 [Oscillospiraceae bacterium]|nr:hypothetical protein [Oscillospiraceae bacterium]